MLCGITESCVFVSRFCHHSRLNKCCQCMDCGTFVNICLYFFVFFVCDGWSRKLYNLRTSRISVSCAVATFTEFLYRWIAIKSITGRYCKRIRDVHGNGIRNGTGNNMGIPWNVKNDATKYKIRERDSRVTCKTYRWLNHAHPRFTVQCSLVKSSLTSGPFPPGIWPTDLLLCSIWSGGTRQYRSRSPSTEASPKTGVHYEDRTQLRVSAMCIELYTTECLGMKDN